MEKYSGTIIALLLQRLAVSIIFEEVFSLKFQF